MTDPFAPQAGLVLLRRLVITLLGVMIVGFVVMIVTFVTRFPSGAVGVPDGLTLPDGITAEAVTFGDSWMAVVSGDEILIYDREEGVLIERIQVNLP